MGGGGGAAPQLNVGQTTQNQTSQNAQTAAAQAALNNVNQVTPYGNLTYDITGSSYDANGNWTPRYTATQTLAPAQQQILDKTNNLQSGALDTAATGLQNVNNSINNPINYSGAPGMPGDQTQAKNDAYAALTARSNTDIGRAQSDQQTQLANQGIAPGTEAYTRAMDTFDRARTDASNQATINAGNVAGQNISQAQTLRNQYIGEQTARHNQPIQDLTSLLGFGGSATNPNLTNTPQTQINPTDTYAPALANYQGQIQQYQTQRANNQGTLGGIAGLGGSILGGLARNTALFTPSDRRLKTDIFPIGQTYDGQTIYRYRFHGDPRMQIGLMAQEVEKVAPEAIGEFGGYMAVDYEKATDKAARMAEMVE